MVHADPPMDLVVQPDLAARYMPVKFRTPEERYLQVSGHLIDARGTAVEGPVEDSVIAASLADLRAARRRIAVAHGAGRAPAVLAAVRAGLVDILVCDIPLRDALAELEGQ